MINAMCNTLCYAENILKENYELLKGVIYSAKSVYVVTEPNSRITMVEGKKYINGHVPFSWLNRLRPTNWFNYKVTINSYSRILTDVKVKLDDGAFEILPFVLLRQTDFVRQDPTDERRLKEYIIDGVPGKKYSDGRLKIKAILTYYRKKIALSNYTKDKNDKISVVIGNVNIMTLHGYKNYEGVYEYSGDEKYTSSENYGLLSFQPHIDESMDENKYSDRN